MTPEDRNLMSAMMSFASAAASYAEVLARHEGREPTMFHDITIRVGRIHDEVIIDGMKVLDQNLNTVSTGGCYGHPLG
jgi:hypothetical protein